MEFTKKKIELGINACITQISFNIEAIVYFKDKLQIPVLPGLIFPSAKSLEFVKKLDIATPTVHDPTEFLRNQVKNLIHAGFQHLHFYTLNNIDNLLFLFYDSI